MKLWSIFIKRQLFSEVNYKIKINKKKIFNRNFLRKSNSKVNRENKNRKILKKLKPLYLIHSFLSKKSSN